MCIAAFLTQTVCLDDTTVKFEIWDTAGQERYHSLAPMYYRGAQAAIVVYDITNQVKFHIICSIRVWKRSCRNIIFTINLVFRIVLVGQKHGSKNCKDKLLLISSLHWLAIKQI